MCTKENFFTGMYMGVKLLSMKVYECLTYLRRVSLIIGHRLLQLFESLCWIVCNTVWQEVCWWWTSKRGKKRSSFGTAGSWSWPRQRWDKEMTMNSHQEGRKSDMWSQKNSTSCIINAALSLWTRNKTW